jgi:predicted transcriptional regulator
MSAPPKTKSITAEIPEDLYQALIELAQARGVSANTVLMQAIQTEKFLAAHEAEGANILLERPDRTIKRLVPTKKTSAAK